MIRLVTLILGVAMAMPAVCAELNTNMLGKVLAAIAQVESGGKNIGTHTDGASHGKYGITMAACRELVRLGKLDAVPLPEALDDPGTNERIARMYVVALYEDRSRSGQSWWLAVGWFHGGDKADREAYAARVWRRL